MAVSLVAFGACVSTKDMLEPIDLSNPVLPGWVWIEVDDPEWQQSGVGFGLSTYLAEAWYETMEIPLANPNEAQRTELLKFQNASSSLTPEAFESYDGPIVYAEVVYASRIRKRANVSVFGRTAETYRVEAKCTVLDLGTGKRVYAFGASEVDRKSNTAVLELRRDTMEFEDTAGYRAVRSAIRQALDKIEPAIAAQKDS